MPLLAVGCLVGVIATTSTPASGATGFANESASSIVAAARSAMTSAGAVSATGTDTEDVAGLGTVHYTVTNYSGPTAGSQVLKSTGTQTHSSSAAPSETTLIKNGALYVNANAPFWSGSAGVPQQTAALMANKWISIPKGSALYAPRRQT